MIMLHVIRGSFPGFVVVKWSFDTYGASLAVRSELYMDGEGGVLVG